MHAADRSLVELPSDTMVLNEVGGRAEERADLMGHGGTSETTERYCDPIEIALAKELIEKLPRLTEDLEPHPIRLLPWIEQREIAPYSRAARARRK